MSYLLFAIYFVLCCWMMTRISFIRKTGIEPRVIIALFALKVLAGIAIGWISLHYYGTGNDYWDVNREGYKEYQLLLSNPGEYFSNFFRSDYPHGYSGFFDSFQSFWNDLRNNLVIKLVSIFNLVSQGNYYINSLFFNSLIFFGHAALYRVFIHRYRAQRMAVIIGCFLLPSTLYFTSGIQKDGIVFALMAMLVYAVYFSLEQKFTAKRVFVILFSFGFLLLFRNYVFIVLLLAVPAWILARRIRWRPVYTFTLIFGIAAVLLFSIQYIFPSINPLNTIVQKQADFLGLFASGTQIEMHPLTPDLAGFAKQAPLALNHVFLRPYLFELPSQILLPMNIELFIYQLLFLVFLFFRTKTESPDRGAMTCFLLFSIFSLFLFIGYIVPNLGSLVRYRSIYLPFLITPMLCSINWAGIRARSIKN